MRRTLVFGTFLAALAALGCEPAHKSASGFHMPDGDPARGQAAFVALRCHACHEVQGVALPAPVAQPALPFALGGRSLRVRTDGELAAAILEPSRGQAWGEREECRAGRLSRMGDFSESMTARDLVDIVAFLHANTQVAPIEHVH
jgi:hypothetical protein